MYSLIAFIITLAEVAIVAGGYLLHSHGVVYQALVYGSPFYLLRTLLTSDSAFLYKNYVYVGIFCMHIVKYFIIFQAQRLDERNIMRTLAILCEATYLCLSAYYTY